MDIFLTFSLVPSLTMSVLNCYNFVNKISLISNPSLTDHQTGQKTGGQ